MYVFIRDFDIVLGSLLMLGRAKVLMELATRYAR